VYGFFIRAITADVPLISAQLSIGCGNHNQAVTDRARMTNTMSKRHENQKATPSSLKAFFAYPDKIYRKNLNHERTQRVKARKGFTIQ